MSDTPEQKQPQNEDSKDPGAEATPKEATSAPQVKAPSKPLKPPSKPVSMAPPAKKAPAKKPDPAITFDKEEKDDAPTVPMLVIDGIAAAVAVVFTVLILRDVMPFL